MIDDLVVGHYGTFASIAFRTLFGIAAKLSRAVASGFANR
jgi:hypothetical protein